MTAARRSVVTHTLVVISPEAGELVKARVCAAAGRPAAHFRAVPLPFAAAMRPAMMATRALRIPVITRGPAVPVAATRTRPTARPATLALVEIAVMIRARMVSVSPALIVSRTTLRDVMGVMVVIAQAIEFVTVVVRRRVLIIQHKAMLFSGPVIVMT